MDIDVATITLIRVGDKITLLSKGDGDLGAMADELLKICGYALEERELEVERCEVTRDPYAGTNQKREEEPC